MLPTGRSSDARGQNVGGRGASPPHLTRAAAHSMTMDTGRRSHDGGRAVAAAASAATVASSAMRRGQSNTTWLWPPLSASAAPPATVRGGKPAPPHPSPSSTRTPPTSAVGGGGTPLRPTGLHNHVATVPAVVVLVAVIGGQRRGWEGFLQDCCGGGAPPPARGRGVPACQCCSVAGGCLGASVTFSMVNASEGDASCGVVQGGAAARS